MKQRIQPNFGRSAPAAAAVQQMVLLRISLKKIQVGWKQRMDSTGPFSQMKFPACELVFVELNKNEAYTFQNLTTVIRNKWLNNKVNVKHAKTFKKSLVQLGDFKDNIIDEDFTFPDGSQGTFWQLARALEGRGGRLNIYLLTTFDFDQ